MIPPPHALRGQVREVRSDTGSEDDSEATTSGRASSSEGGGEEMTSPETEEQEVGEEEELEELEPPRKKVKITVGAASSRVLKKKKELDPVVPRPGHLNDSDFQESARLGSKADVRVKGYLDYFYKALVPEEHRGEFPRDKVRFSIHDSNNRAHDSEKGVAICWKMPHCGF